MFYRLYILFADMLIDEIIKEMLITAFSQFIYIEENKGTLVFQVYNQEHDNHQNVDLERVLSTIFQDTSIKINCFVSQMFSDNQLVEESLAATRTFLEAYKNVLMSKYHVITHSQALAKMYLCYQELALFDEYTNFGELKNNHIELLQVLFKLNNNVVATSNHMYMHRNTINYQLQKIIQITGCDIRNSDDVFLLQLYFFVHDVHRKEMRI
jgi:Regulator of polyketide synthase expression